MSFQCIYHVYVCIIVMYIYIYIYIYIIVITTDIIQIVISYNESVSFNFTLLNNSWFLYSF